MSTNPARLAGGFLALAAIWVGVYWLWEPSRSAGVSFAEQPAGIGAEDGPRQEAIPREVVVEPTPEPEEPARETAPPPPAGGQEDGAATGVLAPEFRDHLVRRGETFESISRKHYGTGRHAGSIAAANPFVSPTGLREGQTLRVPVDPENVQGRPAPGAEPVLPEPEFVEYVVVKGDTLSEIAQRFYGSLRYAEVIYNANRDTMRGADDLQIGDVLRIPSRRSVLGGDDR